jgi:hypothetical protein
MSGKIFSTLIFECPEKISSTSPTFLGKIVDKNKNSLQGIISFCREILAYTPPELKLKRGWFRTCKEERSVDSMCRCAQDTLH